jgi:hypothetical protein
MEGTQMKFGIMPFPIENRANRAGFPVLTIPDRPGWGKMGEKV